jgi:hypothetical protein
MAKAGGRSQLIPVFDAYKGEGMERSITALLLIVQSTAGLAGLSSASPETRVETLLALRKLQGAHVELLPPCQ